MPAHPVEAPSVSAAASVSPASAPASAPPATVPLASEPVLAPPASAADAPWGDLWTWSGSGGDETSVPLAASATAATVPAPEAAPAAGALAPSEAVAAATATSSATVASPAVDAPAPPAVACPSVVFTSDAPRRRTYTIGGKALEWSAAWTVIAVIWALVAVGLAVTRVEMGSVTVMTPAETAAIAAVREIKLPTGASTEAVLRYAATHDLTIEGHVAKIPPGGTQMWYAFDRPWEHRIYVYSQLPGTSMVGKGAVLSWTVSNGVASAAGATRAALTKTAQTMAHPPSSKSVPAIPGIIPSLPPDLQ